MSPVHLISKYFDQQLEVVREFTYIFTMQYIRLLLSIVIDECHCLVMLLEWTMIDTKGAVFMGSCIRELSQQEEHSFATSMSASETSNS